MNNTLLMHPLLGIRFRNFRLLPKDYTGLLKVSFAKGHFFLSEYEIPRDLVKDVYGSDFIMLDYVESPQFI